MINLRYHIVSITAVFLALGIGTALGGTFLDRYTVDVLDRNIRSAEARIRDTERENSRLNRLIHEAEDREEVLIQNGSTALFEGLLDGTPVLIVTSEGVDSDVVANLRQALIRADADVRGTLELRNGLDLGDDVDDDLAEAVERDPDDPEAVRSAVYEQLRDALVDAARPVEEETEEPEESNGPDQTGTTDPTVTTVPDGTPPAGTVTTTTSEQGTTDPTADATTTTSEPTEDEDDDTPDGEQPEIVTTLLDHDLIRLTPGPGLDGEPVLDQGGHRYVFVGGPGLEPTPSQIMRQLLPIASRQTVPAVVVSAAASGADDESTPTIVAAIRSDNDLAANYSTVDQVDTFAGLTATILVLRDLGVAEIGHYGQADGASAVLPGSP